MSTKKILLIASLLLPLAGWSAEEEKASQKTRIPCGILDAFGGEVRTLDAHQARMQEAVAGMEVACDGWVSVSRGWARVKHRNGYRIQIGSESFVRFPASDIESKDGGDQVVLYKGHLAALTGGGAGELRIITANGRARIERGRVWMGFSKSTGETQLTGIEGTATLENRFEASQRITVRAGEFSALNFKLMRVQPSPPMAVSVATLRPRLTDLHLEAPIQEAAYRAAVRRQGRKFASKLVEGDPDQSEIEEKRIAAKGGRVPASYHRHKSSGPDEDNRLKDHLVQRLVGEEKVGEQILYPDRYYGQAQKVAITVEDPAKEFNAKLAQKEREEKQRIIEELTRIRE